MNEIFLILLVLAGGTWFAGVLGAALITFVKKGGLFMRLIPGFAAGVILMVSFVELLHPAIHLAEEASPLPAWVVVPLAFAIGFFGALILDMYINRRSTAASGRFKYKQGVMLLGALSAHSVPEGLALGVLLGALGRGFDIGEIWAILPVFLAVGLHKLPEGTAVSAAFREQGMTKTRSFLFGQASGFLAFLSGVAGFVVAVNINVVLPYAMGFAGGAMIWVAVHELIPKRSEPVVSYFSAIGVFFGVVLMLFVDTTLHNHHHINGHSCECRCISCQSPDHDVIFNRLWQRNLGSEGMLQE
ncbi:MAG: ZIP family metal transporter [Defluviitaleaceae bacterium]|nr:ZIP family metal transporter [Defluviitaleaceae bacterium]